MGKKHSAARGRAGSTGAVPALLCALLCALLPLTATAQSRGGGGERRANPAPQRQTQREPQAERNRTPQRRPAEPPSNQRPNTPQQRPAEQRPNASNQRPAEQRPNAANQRPGEQRPNASNQRPPVNQRPNAANPRPNTPDRQPAPRAAPPQQAISLDQATATAERRYGARVVRANTIESEGRRYHVLRLLSENGRVWTVRVDAATGQER